MTGWKRIRLYLAGAWALAALASFYSIYLARGTPDWYSADPASKEERFAAANQSDQKLADLISYASDIAAARRRRYHGVTTAPVLIGPKTITFTELQINEFLKKWDALLGGEMGERFGDYVSDGRLILLDRHLLIAGTLKGVGVLSKTVVSVEFAPSMDADGKFRPGLQRVYGGRLPLPDLLLKNPRRQLIEGMEAEERQWRRGAAIFPDGLMDHHAMAMQWGKILLAAAMGTSTDAILILPSDMGGLGPAVAVKLVDIQVSDRLLAMKLRPLSEQETQALQAEFSKPGAVAMAGN